MTEYEFQKLETARDDLKESIEDAQTALSLINATMEEGIGSRIASPGVCRK
jgi:hypothetical protein